MAPSNGLGSKRPSRAAGTSAVSYTHLDVYKRQVLDRKQVPRLAVTSPQFDRRSDPDSFQKNVVWYRETAAAPWEKLWEYESLSGQPMGEMTTPIAFDYDNRTLYVASNRGGRDKMALFKYDTKTREFGELVFGHKMIDVRGGLIFSAARCV